MPAMIAATPMKTASPIPSQINAAEPTIAFTIFAQKASFTGAADSVGGCGCSSIGRWVGVGVATTTTTGCPAMTVAVTMDCATAVCMAAVSVSAGAGMADCCATDDPAVAVAGNDAISVTGVEVAFAIAVMVCAAAMVALA